MKSFVAFVALLVVPFFRVSAGELPEAVRTAMDEAVATAISEDKIRGCVILIGRHDETLLERAWGDRQVEPAREPMTVETVFDLASLTKPVATATSVLLLSQRGKLQLDDPVAKYLPAFAVNGKGTITIRDLLTHRAGLIADNPLKDYDDGPVAARQALLELPLLAAPGEKFVYSDVGFLILGLAVEQVSERPLGQFTARELFAPLEMQETGFLPPDVLVQRTAPTTRENDQWLRGRVHDPRAARLGGVAGHAGLFSTAQDLARYARMILEADRGEPALLSRETVRLFWSPHEIPIGRVQDGKPVMARRGLGWDMRSPYSVNRPASFGDRAIGHTGFTGTSIWIDPDLDLFVILLSSRLHPSGKGLSNPLAAKIGELAAQAVLPPNPSP